MFFKGDAEGIVFSFVGRQYIPAQLSHLASPVLFGVSPSPSLFEKARLMDLVGVAADIADAAACSRTAVGCRVAGVARLPDTSIPPPNNMVQTSAPLDLFGCVGEGAPAEAMAEEALNLWVGVSHTPRGAQREVLSLREEGDGRGGRGGGGARERISETGLAMDEATSMDGPILKAIFCTSVSIRLQLAQSLLSVCGGGGGNDGGLLKAKENSASSSPGQTAALSTAPTVASLGTTQQGGQDGQCSDDSPGTAAGTTSTTNKQGPGSTDERSRRGDTGGLRKHVVRLLLGGIPRADKSQAGGAMPILRVGGEEVAKRRALAGDARRRQQEARRRDCTQLFDVLCHLVEESIKSSTDKGRASETGEMVGGCPKHDDFDVDGLTSDVQERLLAHPCTERRGAKEADRDTLLVSPELGHSAAFSRWKGPWVVWNIPNGFF